MHGEQYEAAQSEETDPQLHDQGVEVFHTHLYKGFGMAAEMPEMEDTKRVAEIVHQPRNEGGYLHPVEHHDV